MLLPWYFDHCMHALPFTRGPAIDVPMICSNVQMSCALQGSIKEFGSYQELRARGVEFQLAEVHAQPAREDETDPEQAGSW